MIVLALLLSLPVFALLPNTISLQSNLTDTCGTKIAQLESQIENATSPKIIHFIESNTTAFKSLSQKYILYWISTRYIWSANSTTCSTHLDGITTAFQLSNMTNPFIGVAHITVDSSVTKVSGLKIDIMNNIVPHVHA